MAILAGTTRVVAVADEPSHGAAKPAAPQEVVLPAPHNIIDWEWYAKGRSRGRNVAPRGGAGPDGQPLSGASIYAASTIELLELADADKVGVKDLGPVRAVTDAQGRFEFHAQDLSWVTTAGERKRWETLLVATREDVAPGWLKTWGEDRGLRSHWHPAKSRDVAVRTRVPTTLSGQLLLAGGAPLAHAQLRLTGLMVPIDYDLDKHVPREEEDALGLFETIDYAEQLNRPWVLPGLKTEAATDADGRFELPGLPEGFIARVEVRHPEVVTTSMRIALRPIEPVYRQPFGGQGEPRLTLYGSGFTAELPRGAVLRGRVKSRNSRMWPG